MKHIDLTIDVTDAAGLGEPAHVAATVHLPPADRLRTPAIVCFAKPGAGFSRHYFTADLPGPASGSQAEWHVNNGCIFVSVDHLGVGDSSTHSPVSRLDFTTVVAAANAAEGVICDRLVSGQLDPELPAINDFVKIGIGHSMGACLTVMQQGRFHSYDGIAPLGFSAVYNRTPTLADRDPVVAAWNLPVSGAAEESVILNRSRFEAAFRKYHDKAPSPGDVLANRSPEVNRWLYFYDDVLPHLAQHGDKPSPWVSPTAPGLKNSILTPGIFAPEAAAVDVPVLVVAGERDVLADIKAEPRAYLSANSVELYECPAMGHMHNFAGTRTLLWKKLDLWMNWVVAARGELAR